mmetsp:Transcript_129405/g.235211  ORF Transcript_129405/g.235211 Transcript_129405/m.235211 type:complete len:434 (-) Transcript_129405:48-1349(-)
MHMSQAPSRPGAHRSDGGTSPLAVPTCQKGHRLAFTRVRPGDRGCDSCGTEICVAYAYHCGQCDYDLCGECYLAAGPTEGGAEMQSVRQERREVLRELERLCLDFAELEATRDEQAASDAVALHDAQLLRLRLSAVLQRYREKPPAAEDFVERYEAEIDELATEVQQLREENTALALRAQLRSQPSGLQLNGHGEGVADNVEAQRSSAASSSPSASPRRAGGSRGSVPAPALAPQVLEEVRELWRRRNEAAKLARRARVDEWRLTGLRSETQAVARELRRKDKQLDELRRKHAEAGDLYRELATETLEGREELERQRSGLQELHRTALGLREACHVPAQLKKKSSILMKFLDQEGGRLSTEKHLRSLQAISKLYGAVMTHAPALQPLAGRAKAAMESEFERYQQLEQAHARLLQKLHLVVTRGVMQDGGGTAG